MKAMIGLILTRVLVIAWGLLACLGEPHAGFQFHGTPWQALLLSGILEMCTQLSQSVTKLVMEKLGHPINARLRRGHALEDSRSSSVGLVVYLLVPFAFALTIRHFTPNILTLSSWWSAFSFAVFWMAATLFLGVVARAINSKNASV